jgi:hypothetical protein
MGCDVHITRADEWSESENAPITLDEWSAFVGHDPELRSERAASASLPDGTSLEVELSGLAVWTEWSQHGRSEAAVYFWHSGGCITSRAIDDEVLAKLHRIAQRLGARLVGDDGEEYGSDGRPAVDDAQPLPRRPWWRRIFGGRQLTRPWSRRTSGSIAPSFRYNGTLVCLLLFASRCPLDWNLLPRHSSSACPSSRFVSGLPSNTKASRRQPC